jgi:anti-anti-sigma factor
VNGLNIERIDGVAIVRLADDLDAANAAIVQAQLAAALGPDSLRLIVDLSNTRYVDSAGIDMLLRLGDRLAGRRAKLVLVVPESSPLRRLFAIVGLPDAIDVRAAMDEAID